MSEQVENVQEVEVNEVDTLRSQLADAQKAIEALASKKEELLKETKQAKDERRKAAEIAEQARQEQLIIAQKNGEFEKLWAQEKEEKTRLQQELVQGRQERRNEKIDLVAMKIAVDLAKGDADKAELLSAFVAKSIGNLADEFGNIDKDTLSDVKKQFETDKKYTPLLGGNLSSGGGAPGNTRSAQKDNKTLTRAEFDALDQNKRGQFFAQGGKLTD